MRPMTHRFFRALGWIAWTWALGIVAGRSDAAASKQEVERAERLALEGDAGA